MVLARAREAAAAYLSGRGQVLDADIVRRGGGDDFPEVRIALALARQQQDAHGRYERALRSYADADFWEGEIAEAALAFYDRGAIARAALDGREAFETHRD